MQSVWDAGRAIASVDVPVPAAAPSTPLSAPERVHTVGSWIIVANVCVPGSTVGASTTAALARLKGPSSLK